MVDALADKRLYEQELARTREENAFLQDQVGGLSFFFVFPASWLFTTKHNCTHD